MKTSHAVLAALSLGAFASAYGAPTITDGFTFTSATDSGGSTGTHFHSSTGGDYGNPAGLAEVGSYSTEGVRGLSEWDLNGLTSALTAFVNIEVYSESGLFPGVNDYPFTGFIDVFTYEGNNLENVSDYEIATTGYLGSFAVDPAILDVGDIISFDITAAYNAAIALGDESLGLRLQIADGTATGGGAWTFENIRLTTEAEGEVHGVVPEPSTVIGGLALAGLLGSRLLSRRKA